MADYRLDIKTTAGVLVAQLGNEHGHDEPSKKGFNWMAYTKRVNAPGLLQFELSGKSSVISDLTDKAQVEVWRRDRDADLDWYRDFAGLFRAFQYKYNPPSRYVAVCPGQMSMLGWRIIAYAAGTANRSKYTTIAAETIMKSLVQYNITNDATVGNGRERVGTSDPASHINIEADGAGGNTLDWYCYSDNLLLSLQDLAKIGGGDFDLVKTAAQTWEFRWYAGQLGTDRTATVIFSLGRGNMGTPSYAVDRSGEKTTAVIAGQGEGSSRDYVIRTGTNYSASNDIELFVDARDIDLGDTSALETRGDRKLYDNEARELFDFRVLQTPSARYGLHYVLGDLVTATNPFTGTSTTQKVIGVTVELSEGGQEIIDIEMETP